MALTNYPVMLHNIPESQRPQSFADCDMSCDTVYSGRCLHPVCTLSLSSFIWKHYFKAN